MNKRLTLALMAIAIMIGAYGTALGVSSYATSFKAKYPASPLSALSTVSGQAGNLCTVCHGASGGARNAYGSNFASATIGNHTYNATLEARDSDVDGFTNLAEITAGTFPGNVNSKPATADTTAPTVSLSAPANGASFTTAQNVAINATAADVVGVTKVEFYDGTTLLGTDTLSPYSFTWAISSGSNGSHSLTAKAYDAANNIGTSAAVNVTVNIATADTTAPTVSLSAPANGASFTTAQNVAINATAADVVGVTKVEFYDGTTLLGTDTLSPYSFTWAISSGSNGSHSLTAKAYDAANNIGTSAAVNVTVNIATTPPVLDGAQLYSTNCASCHISLANSSMKGKSASKIQSAINKNKGGMDYLSFLTSAEVKAITDALAETPPSAGTDTKAPKIKKFSLEKNSTSLTVLITLLIAYDDIGVTGYAVTETPSAPTSGWTDTAPTSYTFASEGKNTLYAWAMDAVGNISKGRSAKTNISLDEDGPSDITNAESNEIVMLPAPASQQIFTYDPVESTLRDSDLSVARPVSISGLGDYVSIKADIGRFAEPVDAYITLYSPSETSTEPVNIFTLEDDNEFEFLSDEKEPWRSNATDINEQAIDMHISTLLSGKYMLVLEVTPVGRQDVYYHWITYFIVQ